MVHAIDFDEDNRTIHPTVPTKGDLSQFQISPERHNAYAKMWQIMIYGGVVANSFVWLYL